jgi:hypothetical protein
MPLLGVALDGNGFQGEVCLVLAHILGQIGQVDEGIGEQKASLAFVRGERRRLEFSGELYFRAKQMEAVRKAFERALELNPQPERTNLSRL